MRSMVLLKPMRHSTGQAVEQGRFICITAARQAAAAIYMSGSCHSDAKCKARSETQLVVLTRTLEKQSQGVKVCVCACPPVIGGDLLLTSVMIMQAAHRLLRVCFCDIMMLHRTTIFRQEMPTLAACVPASRATAHAEMLS